MFEIFLELYGDSDSLKIASTSDYCNELDFEKLECYHSGVLYLKDKVSGDRRTIREIGNGEVTETLLKLGWVPARNVARTIKESLAERSNDYSIFNEVSMLLGQCDITDGTAPLLHNYPTVSIVLLGYGIDPQTLTASVDSFIRSAESIGLKKYEIIVTDPQDRDGCLRERRNVSYVCCSRHVCTGDARNIGLALAKGELVVFCDGDTAVHESYLRETLFRHTIAGNLITVCMREDVKSIASLPERLPSVTEDTRYRAVYTPDRIGSVRVERTIEVRALEETDNFKSFGFGKLLGPANLPFMVKGNNICISRKKANIGFPPNFVGYGPEDVTFAAKAIARGCFVVPVLSTGVFHQRHSVRSGSMERHNDELVKNIRRQVHQENTLTWGEWDYDY